MACPPLAPATLWSHVAVALGLTPITRPDCRGRVQRRSAIAIFFTCAHSSSVGARSSWMALQCQHCKRDLPLERLAGPCARCGHSQPGAVHVRRVDRHAAESRDRVGLERDARSRSYPIEVGRKRVRASRIVGIHRERQRLRRARVRAPWLAEARVRSMHGGGRHEARARFTARVPGSYERSTDPSRASVWRRCPPYRRR